MKPPLHPIDLLSRLDPGDLTPEEETIITRELSAAYHLDESSSSNRDVQRISEKIRLRLEQQSDTKVG